MKEQCWNCQFISKIEIFIPDQSCGGVANRCLDGRP